MGAFSMPLNIEDYQKLFGKIELSRYDKIGVSQKFETGYEFCEELKKKNIPYFTCITHPEVLSCLDSQMYYAQYSELLGKDYCICKHLFVHEKKGLKRHFLIIVDNEKNVDLRQLKEDLKLGKLEFCNNEELQELLNTVPGNVSLFHTKFDLEKKVELIIDQELLNRDLLAFHPLYNGMSLFLSPYSAIEYLDSIGREAQIYNVPSKNDYVVLEKTL